MNNTLSLTYTLNQSNVRITTENDTIWFVLKDVCNILGIIDDKQVFDRLDDDERGRYKIPTPGGIQELRCINEPGLYNVISRSNSEKAKPFRRWVTHDVLPSIRKKGYYSLLSDENLINAIKDRARNDLSFLTHINKQEIRKELRQEAEKLKDVRRTQSALLHLHESKYTKQEYWDKLREIWGDDFDGFRKEWEFYLD